MVAMVRLKLPMQKPAMRYTFFSKYTIDTRELINGYRNAKARKGLEILLNHSQLKSPPGVRDELSRVDDDVYAWAIHWENELFIELTNLGLTHVSKLINEYRDPFRNGQNPGITYPGLIKHETANDADPEVIALAMEHGWTVVAEERGIRGACKNEGVDCIALEALLDTEVPEWRCNSLN